MAALPERARSPPVMDDYRCCHCIFRSGTMHSLIDHNVQEHAYVPLKCRSANTSDITGALGYQTHKFNIIPNEYPLLLTFSASNSTVGAKSHPLQYNNRIRDMEEIGSADVARPGIHSAIETNRTQPQARSMCVGSLPQTIGFTNELLRDLHRKTPGYILRTLVKDRSMLMTTLNKNDSNVLTDLLPVLSKAISCDAMPEQLIELIASFKEANFFENSIIYFMRVPSNVSSHEETGFVNAVKDMVTILSEITVRTPNHITQFIGIHECLQKTVDSLHETAAIVDETLPVIFAKFTEQKEKLIGQLQRRRAGVEKQSHLRDADQPPSDFRDIQIFPQLTDINTDSEPFLRVNKARGAYDDVDHYLDVQFRLLREDFIGPLRNGIDEYLQSLNGLRNRRSIQDIRIYHDVRIIRPKRSDHGMSHVILIPKHQLGNVRWESSKRLIYGSLLCLSPDNFRKLYFATVENREPRDITRGYLQVKFQNEHSDVKLLLGMSMVMAETTAYFESYRHVLTGLHATLSNELPFEQYIVRCENKVKAPLYLQRNSVFDIRPLLYDTFILQPSSKLNGALEAAHLARQNIINPPEMKETGGMSKPVHVDILQRNMWPLSNFGHMDRSQVDAIYTALTNEFVITQGPPGTGKTYIGLKIVKTLLHNISNWSKDPITGAADHRPMLIVCYTNHALDQFLEGIVAFFRGDILRIGGRSKSTLLEKYNLKNVRKTIRDLYRHGSEYIRGISRHIVDNRRNLYRDMRELSEIIDNLSARIRTANTRLLNEDTLMQHMGGAYDGIVQPFIQWFEQYCCDYYGLEDEHYSGITEWLGLGNMGFMQSVSEISENAEDYDVDELANFIGVVDGADALRLQRVLDIDDNDDAPTATNKPSPDQSSTGPHDTTLNTENKEINESEWQVERNEHELRKYIQDQLASSDVMDENESNDISDVWLLNIRNRWRLYRLWVHRYCQCQSQRIAHKEDEYNMTAERYQQALLEEDKQLMKLATVIGMTTTGAARYQSLLKEIRPRIVIVEEAAEVFEAHILTTLTKGCDQLIMIGDHKQLKPNPTVYKLATDYNLDMSLFERMVRNGMPCDCLTLQHRMRPEISCLMKHIYKDIRDHEVVEKYENIKGISQNIYCINHNIPETHNNDIRSHLNEFEADYIVSLCNFLLLQGYTASQITILTTYSGQLFCLKKRMPKETFEGVLVTTVDNYQGEENDIVLLSLVRSNNEGNIGFLKIENRVCVALSRAKKGMYLIGNVDCLSKRSTLWKAIKQDMHKKSCIGEGLHLYCQNHPADDGVIAKTSGDFARAPAGGCEKSCKIRLRCGHACSRKCHVIDIEHVEYKCMKDCLTVCTQGHTCKKRCHEECGPCSVIVSKTFLRCGHIQQVECGMDIADMVCKVPCLTVLPCGHDCQAYCGESHTSNCQVNVERTWECGHKMMVKCWQKDDVVCHFACNTLLPCGHDCQAYCGESHTSKCQVNVERTRKCGHKIMVKCWQKDDDEVYHTSKCQVKVERTRKCGHQMMGKCWQKVDDEVCHFACSTLLSCGHTCSGTCSTCFRGRLHLPCQHKCKRVLVCGHYCDDKCDGCPPCQRKCESKCMHRKCQRSCGTPCIPCMEPCAWRCEHYKCIRKCSDPCSRPRCDIPCNKKLPCGHQCIGLCGERCPPLCKICNRDKLSALDCDNANIDIQHARFVVLQDCNHIMEYRALDRYMDTKVKLGDESVYAVELKVCPQCNTIIRKCSRYGYTINTTLHDIEYVKKTMIGMPSTITKLKNTILRNELFRSCEYGKDRVGIRRIMNILFRADTNCDMDSVHAILECLYGYVSNKRMKTERELQIMLGKIQLLALARPIVKSWSYPLFLKDRGSMSVRFLADAKQELKRQITDDMLSEWKIRVDVNDEVRDAATFAVDILANGKKLTGDEEWIVKQTVEKLVKQKHISDTSRHIMVDKAFKDIVAVDDTKGNWRMCSKRHLYEISDDCVGSYEGSKCQECANVVRDGCRQKLFTSVHRGISGHGRDNRTAGPSGNRPVTTTGPSRNRPATTAGPSRNQPATTAGPSRNRPATNADNESRFKSDTDRGSYRHTTDVDNESRFKSDTDRGSYRHTTDVDNESRFKSDTDRGSYRHTTAAAYESRFKNDEDDRERHYYDKYVGKGSITFERGGRGRSFGDRRKTNDYAVSYPNLSKRRSSNSGQQYLPNKRPEDEFEQNELSFHDRRIMDKENHGANISFEASHKSVDADDWRKRPVDVGEDMLRKNDVKQDSAHHCTKSGI